GNMARPSSPPPGRTVRSGCGRKPPGGRSWSYPCRGWQMLTSREFATPEARAAFKKRQEQNFGDFDELIGRTSDLLPGVERQLAELDGVLAGREHVDADDFVLYPSLRMLSIVKGVMYPANVRRDVERLERKRWF